MSCGNQPAYISVIIVAALPSVDGTAAQSKVKGKAHQGEKTSQRHHDHGEVDKSLHISRWSRAKRETTGKRRHHNPTPAGVTYDARAVFAIERVPIDTAHRNRYRAFPGTR